MNKLASAVLSMALLLPLLSSSSARGAPKSECQDSATLLRAMFYSPWPPVGFSIPGVDFDKEIAERGSLTERQILEYFVSSEDRIPTITSSVEYWNHEPSERTTLLRTWEFPGLKIWGEVGLDGHAWYRRMVLDSADYPVLCELGVGVSFERFRELLGEPHRSASKAGQNPSRTYIYLDGNDVTDHSIHIDTDAEDVVVRISWEMEVGH